MWGSLRPSSLPGLLSCRSCSYTAANLALSADDLAALYTSKYFAGEEYKDYVGERRLIEKHFRIRVKKLLRHVANPETKSLFEIGSAYGFFLSVARDYFQSVAGIDISRDAVAYAAGTLGLPVTAATFRL